MNKRHFESSHGRALCAAFILLLMLIFSIDAAAWADSDKTTLYENESGSGFELQKSIKGDHGVVNSGMTIEASQKSSLNVGSEGVDLMTGGRVGLAGELSAISEQYKAGDKNLSLSAQGQAKIEALLGAENKINAHIDEKGISIGADAKAGAYVSAGAEATFEAEVFDIKTNVTVYGEAHAGALAQGTANVTIGFDGKVKFEIGAGVAVGVGASAGMAFEVDASDLMEKYGLSDTVELVAWAEKFVKDPQKTIDDLKDQAIEHVKDKTYGYVDDFIQGRIDSISDIPIIQEIGEAKRLISEGASNGDPFLRYGNWYGPGWSGGAEGSVGDKPPVDALDAIAMRHDLAYGIAVEQGKIYGPREEQRLKAIADAIAVRDVSKLDADPSKWIPPASDPEKARRYRERIEFGFGYTSIGRDKASDLLNTWDWITSPLYNYYLDYSKNTGLTAEQLELWVNIRIKNWYRDHPEAGVSPNKDWVNPNKDWINPNKDWINPNKDWVNPNKDWVSPY